MMFRMGGAEAFARQHVSMADNRQNDTRPIQPSQPPMASQIHPESHRPIADSPEWHGGGRPCDQCGEATEQFQVIVLVKQIAKITDGLVHVLVSAPIVPDTIAALVMRAQVAVNTSLLKMLSNRLMVMRRGPSCVSAYKPVKLSATANRTAGDWTWKNHTVWPKERSLASTHNGTWPLWSSMQWRIYALPP